MSNPFLVDGKTLQQIAFEARDEVIAEYEARHAEAMAKIERAGAKIGDTVTVTWEVDRAYGNRDLTQTGKISRLDKWITVEPGYQSPGRLDMPVSMIGTIRVESGDAAIRQTSESFLEDGPTHETQARELVEQDEANPFINPQANPFMVQ